jgi:TetR/AcrR family transcriptional regulator, lmrAB and yxaGH operons repressor
MSRPLTIEKDVVTSQLSDLFRKSGYEGASLAQLADRTGLKKASLYHRFPGGKQQMAQESLEAAGKWIAENVLAPLQSDGDPLARLTAAGKALDTFYDGGKRACLLNKLAGDDLPFTSPIKSMFSALIAAFKKLAIDAGARSKDAHARAARTVALLEGSLVLSCGMDDPAHFKNFIANLPRELGITQ